MSCSASFSDIVDLPFASFLNGMKLSNCDHCDPQDFVKAITTFSLRPLQCCLVLHPWISFAIVTAIFCFMTLYLVHLCSSRRTNSGDIYILQDISPNIGKDGGEYKIKIDSNKEKIILISKPDYERQMEFSMSDISTFYMHPTLFGFDWQNSKGKHSTYYFGTVQGLQMKKEIDTIFERHKKTQ